MVEVPTTGKDHFHDAERLLIESGETADASVANWKVAKAQAHATLALAAYARDYLPGRMS